MSKKNFPIKDAETGKEYWISRSNAVAAVIYAKHPITGELHFLAEQRGPGCPDYVGCYAFLCGYLDFDETREEAIKREAYEELGLDLSPYNIIEWKTDDNPSHDPRQNIVTRYAIEASWEYLNQVVQKRNLDSESRGGEANEVSDLKLIPKSQAGSYKWAWNHLSLIATLEEDLDMIKKIWEIKGHKN